MREASLHVQIFFPENKQAAGAAAIRSIDKLLGRTLSAGNACATPFTEVYGAVCGKGGVRAQVIGMGSLSACAHRQEGFEFIGSQLRDLFGRDESIVVKDMEGIFPPICYNGPC